MELKSLKRRWGFSRLALKRRRLEGGAGIR